MKPFSAIRGRCAAHRARGFTLIELLAVVGVIALLSVLAVGGYTGIMRAMSESTAADGLRRTILLARQQACVDGTDLWVWPTGENKFIVIRKIGTVVDREKGSVKVPYLRNDTRTSDWIYDPYADMEDASGALSTAENLDDGTYKKIAEEFVAKFAAQYVFDLDEESQRLAAYEYPPWYDEGRRSWIFGVKAVSGSLGTDDFAIGHEYGVVVQSEQYLPKGYLFKGSVDDDGEFKPDWARRNAVHVMADGRVDKDVTFEITDGSERDDAVTLKVIVRRDGTVEAR